MTVWTVLLSDPAGVDSGVLGRFFASQKKILLLDAQRLARHAWGFLGDDLSEEEARTLVRSAEAAGIQAIAIEKGGVVHLPGPQAVRGLVFEGDRVEFRVGVPAHLQPLPLSRLQLFSVVNLRQDTSTVRTIQEQASMGRKIAGLGVMLSTGIPVGMGKGKSLQKTVTETEWVLTLDIFGKGGRWRIVPAAFDFSGLGKDIGTAGPDNLRRLLQRLHVECPSALLNRGARWWLEGRPLNTTGYDEVSDGDQEARWLLTLAQGQ
jgi:hypothetical protein